MQSPTFHRWMKDTKMLLRGAWYSPNISFDFVLRVRVIKEMKQLTYQV